MSEWVRVTCISGRLFLPPGDFEKGVLEEGESVILPKELRERIFRNELVNNRVIKVEDVEEPTADRSKIYSLKVKQEEDIVISKPGDILDQNVRTVLKILQERNFSDDDLRDLLAKETSGRNRKYIVNAINKRLPQEVKKGV